MRTLLIATAIAGLLLAAVPTGLTQTGSEFRVQGTYLIGSPVAWGFMDACGTNGETSGLDSSCAPLPPGMSEYGIEIQDSLGSILTASVCFYNDDGWIACDPAIVPEDADKFSVTSIGGVGVHWVVTFRS